jgi:hypothetical protein
MLHGVNTELRDHIDWIESPPISAQFDDMSVVKHPTGPKCLRLRYRTRTGVLSIFWTQVVQELDVSYEDLPRRYTLELGALCRAGGVPFRRSESVIEVAAFLADVFASNSDLLTGDEIAFARAKEIADRANEDYTRRMG